MSRTAVYSNGIRSSAYSTARRQASWWALGLGFRGIPSRWDIVAISYKVTSSSDATTSAAAADDGEHNRRRCAIARSIDRLTDIPRCCRRWRQS